MAKKESVVEVEGRQIKLSNLEKVLYPKAGFTKGQVIDYYARIAPVLLPHLAGRPLTLKRYPNGVEGMHFYEKNCPSYRPEWMKTAKVWSAGNNRFMDYCVVADLPSLVWLGNLADLELHTSLSRAPQMQRPTVIAFDLDPGAPADMVQCCQVALWIRAIFEEFELQAFAKTSGSKGLQIYVPLNTAVTYERTRPFANAIARLLEQSHPGQVVSDMKKPCGSTRSLSIGARTTITKPRSASTLCVPRTSQPCPPRLRGRKWKIAWPGATLRCWYLPLIKS
jgi:bifunctional non-homologous end joining protein LigD